MLVLPNNEISLFLEVISKDGLVCYVTSLTPVQYDADCKFFNCQLKYGEKQHVNGVVFCSEKRRIVKKYSDHKSPSKISKYSIENRYGSTSVKMNNETFFKDASKPNFEHDQGKKKIKSFPGDIYITLRQSNQ